MQLQGKLPLQNSPAMDIFKQLVTSFDSEGRYHLFNAMANQLRYPNRYIITRIPTFFSSILFVLSCPVLSCPVLTDFVQSSQSVIDIVTIPRRAPLPTLLTSPLRTLLLFCTPMQSHALFLVRCLGLVRRSRFRGCPRTDNKGSVGEAYCTPTAPCKYSRLELFNLIRHTTLHNLLCLLSSNQSHNYDCHSQLPHIIN